MGPYDVIKVNYTQTEMNGSIYVSILERNGSVNRWNSPLWRRSAARVRNDKRRYRRHSRVEILFGHLKATQPRAGYPSHRGVPIAGRQGSPFSVDLQAELSCLGTSTIKRIEAVDAEPSGTAANMSALRNKFEAAGIEFIEADDASRGIMVRARRDV